MSFIAWVNAPFLCPKSSLSTRPSGMAPQLIGTKGLRERTLLKWMARATISLPVPVSPKMSTLILVSLRRLTRS